MQALKQIVTVPETRELRIQLPPDALTLEEAEVIVLFKSDSADFDSKLAVMQEAENDELFLSDLRETLEEFRHADAEEALA